MKYLSNYTEEAMSKLWEETGAFFCFSDDQFNSQRKEGIEYVSLGAGLVSPKDKIRQVIEGMDRVRTEGIKKDKEENGKENIIKRELYNYECFYTGDYSDAVSALTEYGYSEEDVKEGYRKERENAEQYM